MSVKNAQVSLRALTYGAEPMRLYAAPLEPTHGAPNPLARLDSSTYTVRWWLTMLRRILARLRRALDLARLLDLPDRHPDRMIAASIVLFVGLRIINTITSGNYWKAAQP
jgi:hypothetical protein